VPDVSPIDSRRGWVIVLAKGGADRGMSFVGQRANHRQIPWPPSALIRYAKSLTRLRPTGVVNPGGVEPFMRTSS
jgi:hypothetical protein